jgi:hypothetical protein
MLKELVSASVRVLCFACLHTRDTLFCLFSNKRFCFEVIHIHTPTPHSTLFSFSGYSVFRCEPHCIYTLWTSVPLFFVVGNSASSEQRIITSCTLQVSIHFDHLSNRLNRYQVCNSASQSPGKFRTTHNYKQAVYK